MKLVLTAYPNGQVSVYRQRIMSSDDPVRSPLPPAYEPDRKQQLIREYLPLIGAEAIIEAERKNGRSPGLVNGSQSASKTRRVAKALTRHGRRMIECAMTVMESRWKRDVLSFLTLTLPPAAVVEALRNPDGLRASYRHFRKILQQKLARAGLPDVFASVCEIHPQRSEREGIAIPHWHLAFVGRKPGKSWEVSTTWVQETWANSLARNGLIPDDVELVAATNVQPVRKSLRRYMSKYLGKGYAVPESVNEEKYFSLLPGQMHYVGEKLLKMVKQGITKLVGGAAEVFWESINRLKKSAVRLSGTVDFVREDGSKHVLVWWYFLTDSGMKEMGLL